MILVVKKWWYIMERELEESVRKKNQRYTKVTLVSIGFICACFLLYFIKEFIALFRFTPQLDIFQEAYDILNPVLFYSIFGVGIVGLILLIINLDYVRKIATQFGDKIIVTRNLFITALIIRTLTLLYYIFIAFAAWGDDSFLQSFMVGGDLINHLFILIPLLYLSNTLKKARKENPDQITRLILPPIIFWYLVVWIIGYLVEVFVNFVLFNNQNAIEITIMINSLVQMIFNSYGIAMFIELAKKREKIFF